MSKSMESALRFNDAEIHPNDEGNMLLKLRERGYTVVSGVFETDSVPAYLEQLKTFINATDKWYMPYEVDMSSPLTVHPAQAPRLRHILKRAFQWDRTPREICLGHAAWLVKPANPEERQVHDWHKDGDHEGLGSVGGGYQYPMWLHVSMAFEDMTLAHGPTYVVPRSHRDPNISPHDGANEEPLLMSRGDVVIWDQRLWHRASPRTVEGLRIMAIFGFFAVPQITALSPAQKAAWQGADSVADQVLFGGPFGAIARPSADAG